MTAVLSALALAAPIAGAGAATPTAPGPGFSLSAFLSQLGLVGLPPSVDFAPIPGTTFSKGPTVVDAVFNGATVVQVDNGTALNSVIGSP
ncbi:MAG TPA: hypothetical protein VH210_10070 [Gaiellaceae bacterium]|nr:hypothetical protein [Gaiellaceae bacterium]